MSSIHAPAGCSRRKTAQLHLLLGDVATELDVGKILGMMATPRVVVHAPVEVGVGAGSSASRLEDRDQNMTSVDVVVDSGLSGWIVQVTICSEIKISTGNKTSGESHLGDSSSSTAQLQQVDVVVAAVAQSRHNAEDVRGDRILANRRWDLDEEVFVFIGVAVDVLQPKVTTEQGSIGSKTAEVIAAVVVAWFHWFAALLGFDALFLVGLELRLLT